jgi:NAD(P)-dependent dehydrogenase (short-subunit alcohol dehydrogenase family)
MRGAGAGAVGVAMEVTDGASVDAAVAEAAGALGEIDVLVNIAGVAITRPFLDLTERDWAAVLDVNLDGAFRVAQAVARRMRDTGRGGSIVNVASVLAERVAAQVAPYATSKAALVQLTRAMAVELARDGIRVNALSPGVIRTPFHDRVSSPELLKAMEATIPMKRLGEADECSGAILFLASDAMSGYVTGQIVEVNGGQLMA